MLFHDQVASSALNYTGVVCETHPSEVIISSQITSPSPDCVDFLFWSSRQLSSDAVIDYDV